MYLSCSEIGQDGLNLVEQDGHNAWIEEALQGGNQTYLLLQVTNIASPHCRHCRQDLELYLYQDPLAVGNVIDQLLCMNN